MVRVMFYTGIVLLLISAALLYLPTCFCCILALILAILLLVLFVFRKKIHIAGLKTLLIFSLVFLIFGLFTLQFRVKPVQNLDDKTAIIIGSIADFSDVNESYTAYTIKAQRIVVTDKDGNEIRVIYNQKVRVTDIYDSGFDVFEKVKLSVKFTPLGDFKSSTYSKGVYCSANLLKRGESLGDFDRPIYAIFYDLRKNLSKRIFENLPFDEATISAAVLLGDFEFLDEDFYLNSKITGVTHMLVVSGMHLGIIFTALYFLLSLVKAPKRLISIISIFVIFALAAVCGFSPSIIRAGLTYFIMSLGMFFLLKPDPLNSLGIAATVICFVSPFSAGNISFLLSFLSTFGIIFVCPMLYEKCILLLNGMLFNTKLFKGILFAICQTVSATICTLPISVLVFGYISIVSVLVNVLIGYAMSFVLVLSIAFVILVSLEIKSPVINTLVSTVLCLGIRYSVFIINSMAKLENSVTAAEILYLVPWLLLVITVLLFVIGKSSKFSAVLRKACASLSVVLFLIVYLFIPKTNLEVLSLGNGAAVVIRMDDKIIAVGAGDGEFDIQKIKNSVVGLGDNQIDLLILPTLEKDFSGGAPKLINEYENLSVCLPNDGEFTQKLNYVNNGKYTYFENKASIILNNDFELLIYKDKGVIINSKEMSVVIACSDDVSAFLSDAKRENVLLICCNKVPNNIEKSNIKEIVFVGDEENFTKYKGNLVKNTFKKSISYKIR